MPRRAWLTPNGPPIGRFCIKVELPDSAEFEALFLGALLSLTEEWQWEQSGDMTAEETAEFFWDVFQSIQHENCEELMMPIGSVFWWAGHFGNIPPTLLECKGQPVDNRLYPDLFEVLGYRYGGAYELFLLPDLVGRGIVGAGWYSYDLGETGGNAEVTLSASNLPPHQHGIRATGISGAGAAVQLATGQANYNTTLPSTTPEPINVMNPYMALIPVIVAKTS